jgi:DNA repair protein RadC
MPSWLPCCSRVVKRPAALLVAELLLQAVGGIPGLMRTHPEALVALPGIGEAAAVRLLAAFALPTRRHPWGAVRAAGLEELVPVFEPVLAGLRHERLAVAVCDRRGWVRAVRAVADGATDGAPLPVRDVIATVLRHDGHAFAIAHNHPSGVLTPSTADRNATVRFHAAADAAGLRFHGHLILGEHRTWNTA